MSEKLARELFCEAQEFADTLQSVGWIQSPGGFGDNKSPLDLFKAPERPLVVGLFGGTGAGKSSLLNRLAGDDIARTGVVRPTSMEITAYLHADVQLEALPDHYDASFFSANRHRNDQLADVMWLDMPDFDSDETDNKNQVLQWLPHIDLLVYVVTPERYKDAEGWRLMLDNGYRHAWIFVINQWDRAESVQFEDFNRLLKAAGFSSPQIFRTVCVGTHEDDQFKQMVSLISSLSAHNIVAHLQERGWMQRLQRSRDQLQQHIDALSAQSNVQLSEKFAGFWQEFEQSCVSHLDHTFKVYSEQFAKQKTSAVSNVVKSLTGSASATEVAASIAKKSDVKSMWDDWLDVRSKDTWQRFKLAQTEHGVPADAFDHDAKDLTADNAAIVTRQLEQSVESAIRQPGTAGQRLAAKCAAVAKITLPLLALTWVVWRVINGFVSGAEDRSAYVGLDFLVNGLLLAGLGWLIPMIVERVFVPSLPDSVYRALHQGLEAGLKQIRQSINSTLDDTQSNRHRYLADAESIDTRINQLLNVATASPDARLDDVLRSAPVHPASE